MRKLRAKFSCNAIENDMVKLSAVYGNDDKDNEENNQFSEATPYGELEMMISNPDAKDFFEVGKNYYLDFQEANN
jgi:hypothetical protein